ncbi:MAG TPA: acetamidase/formamidase family protein [Bacillota bacterium]|nr:acetamidase/formamidase family protein [Bacillota bacterium]
MATTHFLPKDKLHFLWDTSHEPALRIKSGDTVVLETAEITDDQIEFSSKTEVIDKLDWDRMYPLSGPIYVEGAEPGDTLAVEILDLQTRGWGWAGVVPGLGLLADDFDETLLRTFDLSDGKYVHFRDDIKIPIEPFMGTMGVCPKDAKEQNAIKPGVFGGNIDTRQLTKGTTLYLPIEEKGALFSCGDGHAAQGDGEVCGTGIEAPLYASLRFTLIKGQSIPAPQYKTSGGLTPLVKDSNFYGTTGVGEDLYKAAQDAIRAMVDYISKTYDMPKIEAYVLCSLCVDLKISEIVNVEQYIVSALLPLSIFKKE